MPDRSCHGWKLKDNYEPKPMEKVIAKCCGVCKYYCPVYCCKHPLYKPCKD